jgi:hypothetical protein
MVAGLMQLKLEYYLVGKEAESEDFSIILENRENMVYNSILNYLIEYSKKSALHNKVSIINYIAKCEKVTR